MDLIDSRRLTGPNLVWNHPGALLDVAFSDGRIVDLWKEEIIELRSNLGLPDMGIQVKRRPEGAWLLVGGPVDQLYGLIETSELAWSRAMQRLHGDSPSEPDLSLLKVELKEEENPRLIALQKAAFQKNVTFLWDDDDVSLGMGTGSQTWPARDLPDPSDIDWSSFHDIPVAVVTGTNGKTTTIRLLCAMAQAWGKTYGNTSTDRVRVNEDVLDTGDYSGPGGARTALRDQRVEIALLETARGGLLRRGAGIQNARVAAVLNVAEDHMGQYGINSLADLVEAKLIVQKLVSDHGLLVLNADDPSLVEASKTFPDQRICWFSLLSETSNESVVIRNGMITAVFDGQTTAIARVADIPITLGGKATYNVSNALAATALAIGLGMPEEAIRTGLTSFESSFENNPGRSNYFDVRNIRVLLDYAHNPHGLKAILDTTARLGAKKRIMVLSTAGDRTETEIRDLARVAAASGVDEVLVSDCVGYEREMGKGGVPQLLADEFAQHGMTTDQFSSELIAVREAFNRAQAGDLLMLLVKGERMECLAEIQHQQTLD